MHTHIDIHTYMHTRNNDHIQKHKSIKKIKSSKQPDIKICFRKFVDFVSFEDSKQSQRLPGGPLMSTNV